MLAWATAARRSVCIAPDMIGIIVEPRPMPITNSTAPSVQYDVSAPIWVSASIAPRVSVRPTSTMRPTPVRSVSCPAIGITSIAPKPCGASSRPACIADSPRTAWK